MMSLLEHLNSETVDNLKRRLKPLPYPGSINLKKGELIQLITEHLNLEHLKCDWETHLTDLDKKAIAEVVYGAPDFIFDAAQFYAKYQKDPQFFRLDQQKSHYYSNQTLTLLGVFFFNQQMPHELQKRFESFIEKPQKSNLVSTAILPDIPDLVIKPRENAALCELKIILKLIFDGKIKASEKTYQPSAASIKVIEANLYDGDFYSEANKKIPERYEQSIGAMRAFAWVLLIQAGKLARLSGTTLELTPAGKKALNLPAEAVIKKLWQNWLESNLLDEFRRIEAIKGQTGKGSRDFTVPKQRRQVIEKALQNAPTGEWIHFDAFSRYMLSNRFTFEVVKTAPWRLYICDPEYGALGHDGYHDWNILQDRYLLCFLFEYAASLGLIDVAYLNPKDARDDFRELWGADDLSFLSRYDGLAYFKINPLGAFCLNLDTVYQPSVPLNTDNLSITINERGHIAINSSPIPAEALIILGQFCRTENQKTWILDQESLISALETRYDLAALTAFFTKYQVLVPDNIQSLIEDIGKKSKELTMKNKMVLFECSCPKTAHHFSSVPAINRYCSLVGEKLLAVPEEKLLKFKNEIKKLGYVLHV